MKTMRKSLGGTARVGTMEKSGCKGPSEGGWRKNYDENPDRKEYSDASNNTDWKIKSEALDEDGIYGEERSGNLTR